MHSCRRRLRGRLARVLPLANDLQHQLLPVTPSTEQSRRLVPWPKGLLQTSIVSGNEDATNATAAARVHFWRGGLSSLPSLPMTYNDGVTSSRPDVCCRFERYMSTAAAERKSAGSPPPSSPPPPPRPPLSSASLQKRLRISDAEAKRIRGRRQTTKAGFENLVTINHGRCDESGEGSTGTPLGSGSTFSDSPSRSSPQAPPCSCFSRFLLDDLRAKPKDIKSLVVRRPVVLGWKAGAAEKAARWLQARLGMRRSEVARLLLKHPEAGTKSVEKNIEVKVEWLQENLDLGEADSRGVVKVLLHAPEILNLSIERSLDPMLLWLRERLGLSRVEAAKIARDNPTMFWLSVESNLEPTLVWLQQRLETDERSVAQMVTAAPNILSLNIHTGLEPKLAWLQERVGLSPLEMCDVLSREPTILYKSVGENLEPTLAWMKTHLRLDDQATREMFVAFPRLVGSSLGDNLKLKIPWLQSSLGLDAREAVALAKRAPALLQYSIERNLDPTVLFFRQEMNASEEELRESVMLNPKLLGYSLDGRLRPRLAAMRKANIAPVFSKHRNHVGHWPDTTFLGFMEQHRR